MVLMVAPVAAFTFFAKFNIALFAKLRVLTVCPSGLNVQRHLASAKSDCTQLCAENFDPTNFDPIFYVLINFDLWQILPSKQSLISFFLSSKTLISG